MSEVAGMTLMGGRRWGVRGGVMMMSYPTLSSQKITRTKNSVDQVIMSYPTNCQLSMLFFKYIFKQNVKFKISKKFQT